MKLSELLTEDDVHACVCGGGYRLPFRDLDPEGKALIERTTMNLRLKLQRRLSGVVAFEEEPKQTPST